LRYVRGEDSALASSSPGGLLPYLTLKEFRGVIITSHFVSLPLLPRRRAQLKPESEHKPEAPPALVQINRATQPPLLSLLQGVGLEVPAADETTEQTKERVKKKLLYLRTILKDHHLEQLKDPVLESTPTVHLGVGDLEMTIGNETAAQTKARIKRILTQHHTR
jgi:hypothetical protein